MSYRPASEDDQIPPDLARVRDEVACELYAQLALRGETIDQADVCGVAHSVAVRLGGRFRIEERPGPDAGPGDDDSLGLDGATFHGSVLPGGDGRGPSERYPVFDRAWPARP
ncbi:MULTISPECIES: hypothetical protein [Polymorphospora]|uniref:Uncharacterized protein n=1 Tax=Polymorphospora lycopeni TaxID=3140240 RepID=A0ABV5CSA7_9ACTN